MTIEDKLNEIKSRETAAFNYSGEFKITESSREPCFNGSIDLLTTAKIKVSYNPHFEEEAKSIDIGKDPTIEAATAVIRHELNHKGGGKYKGCPRTIDLHEERILQPISETLTRLEFPNVPITSGQTLYEYMANLLEDVIDNSEIGIRQDHIGMFVCYKDDGVHAKDGRLTPLFDAFVMLQERLYGRRRSTELLRKHHSGDDKAKTAVDNFMTRTGIAGYTKPATSRKKKKAPAVLDKKKAVRHCLDENNWPTLSRILAEEFSKLIDKSKLDQPQYLKETFMPLKGSGDGFSDEMDNPETQMKFVWKRYQAGKKGGTGQFEPPAYLDKNLSLDLVYQRLARNLEIKTDAPTREEKMPVGWYGKKPFNPVYDLPKRLSLGLGEGGKLELQTRRHTIETKAQCVESRGVLPAVRFIMRDDSESMRWAVEGSDTGTIMNPWADAKHQWGDKCRYHYALIAEWGLYEFLRKQGVLKHTSVKSVSYSSSTRTALDLKEAKKQALNPTFGGTVLDMDKMRTMFGKDELVLSMSDGDIANWNQYAIAPVTDENGNVTKEGVLVKDEYVRLAKQNEYIHFQMGNFVRDDKGVVLNKPAMCQDLEAAGLHVYYDDGRNLGKLVIDLTRPYVTGKK
jgi:hypothetical protein